MRKPNFIICGEMKCGTSAMSDLLKQSPDIGVNNLRPWWKKGIGELHFFNRVYHQHDIDVYYDSFDHLDEKIVGEKTAEYLACPFAFQRIARHMSDVKLVIMVRDPVDRYISQLQMMNRNKQPWQFRTSDAFDRGQYADHIKRAFDLFPKDQIKIVLMEQMKDDPKLIIDDITEWLGIESIEGIAKPQQLTHSKDVLGSLQEELADLYRPHSQRLYELLEGQSPLDRERISKWKGM